MATASWKLAVICLSALALAQDVRLPPTITHGPAPFTYFTEDRRVELTCTAEGHPTPNIEWRKDGVSVGLSPSRINQMSNGNLAINPLTVSDNGTYQCFAQNPHGRAMSNYAHLVRSKLSSFYDSIREIEVDEGEPFSISCLQGRSIPVPVFTWYLVRSKMDTQPRQVDVTNRVNIDQQGNLIFSHASMQDNTAEYLYMCRAFNDKLGSLSQGSYTRVTVNSKTSARPHAPLLYSLRNDHVVGLVGSAITLQCVFSGNPTPMVTWTRANNLAMPNTFNLEWTGAMSVAKIGNLIDEDGGVYVCEGQNSEGSSTVDIMVDVQAAPFFANIEDRPQNKDVRQGEDVAFVCRPRGEPTPDIQWYINGEKINPGGAGRNRQISADLQTLTIDNVCKNDCVGGKPDNMVIQCEASNIHGSFIANGYLNVVDSQ